MGKIGIPGALLVLFVALKLLGKIDWSWFWVLSPVIFFPGFLLLIFAGAIAYSIYKEEYKNGKTERTREVN